LQNQPVDIVTRNETARGDRHDLGPAPRAPRLNLANLVSVQQDPVAPAPSPKRSYLPARLDSQPRPYSLLYSHSGITFEVSFLLRGRSKIYENRRTLSRSIFGKNNRIDSSFFLDFAVRVFENIREIFRFAPKAD